MFSRKVQRIHKNIIFHRPRNIKRQNSELHSFRSEQKMTINPLPQQKHQQRYIARKKHTGEKRERHNTTHYRSDENGSETQKSVDKFESELIFNNQFAENKFIGWKTQQQFI